MDNELPYEEVPEFQPELEPRRGKARRRNAVREGLIYRDAILHKDDCKVLEKLRGYVIVYWLKLGRMTRVNWNVFDHFKLIGDVDDRRP